MKANIAAVTATRLVIFVLIAVAIWSSPSVISDICGTLGTLMWLFMGKIVAIEKKIYRRYKK